MPSPVQPHPKVNKVPASEGSGDNDLDPIGIGLAANRLHVKGTYSPKFNLSAG
jgi:hypothetical protein